MDLKAIAEHLNAEVEREAIAYARDIDLLANGALKELGAVHYSIVKPCVYEAAFNAAKDIYKNMLYHPNGIEQIKLFGYLCFWVRKIKPVMGGVKADGSPFRDINEMVAIRMAAQLCIRYAKLHREDIPNSDVDAVKNRAKAFLNDPRRVDYLIHSMRYRTFGPHHFVMLLQNVVYGF